MAKKSVAEKELEAFDVVFKALAHPTRRHILIILRSRGDQITGDIVNRFAHQWPTISRHLRQLENAGLVTVSKSGREITYAINREKMNNTLKNWLRWF